MLSEGGKNVLGENIPEWELKFSYFYVNHKIFIKRGLFFLLFFFDLVVIFTFGAIFINYKTGLIKDRDFVQEMPLNLVSQEAIVSNKPVDLKIGNVYILSAGYNKYDLMASISNTNKNWAVEKINYSFTVGGIETETLTTFILPSSVRYLSKFNFDEYSASVSLNILGIVWRRIEDYSLVSYQNELKISNTAYVLSGVSQVNFDIFNNTPFDFWEVGCLIVLENSRFDPLGISYVNLNKLMSHETRTVNLGWLSPVTGDVYQISVYPEVNLLSTDTVMDIEATYQSPPGRE